MEKFAIGADLGGTKTEVVLVSEKGELVDCLRIPTDSSQGPSKTIDRISQVIADLRAKHKNVRLDALGIGVAGQINKTSGVVVYAPNLGWNNLDVRSQLERRCSVPTVVCNDVKAAAWGEWLLGAGVGCADMVCIFAGTGVGGAVVCNGAMLDGHNNTAGEIGHLTIQIDGPMCTCGNYGCLEAIAGGWAIQRDAQEAVLRDRTCSQTLLMLTNGNPDDITAEIVSVAARTGDEFSIKLMNRVVDALAAGVVSIVNLLSPERVILGGGIIDGNPDLISKIAKKVQHRALKAAAINLQILPPKFQGNAGAIGAGLYALQMLRLKT